MKKIGIRIVLILAALVGLYFGFAHNTTTGILTLIIYLLFVVIVIQNDDLYYFVSKYL